jgi:H+/Cl- antiporter ClcA
VSYLTISRFKQLSLFIFLAALIGVFAVFFAISCSYAFKLFQIANIKLGCYSLLIIPAGFVMIVYLIKNYFPEAEGSGMPQVIALGHTEEIDKLSRFFVARAIFSKYIFIVLGTCLGASIGREGSTVQIGATIMTLGHKNLSRLQRKTLLTAGAAAGLAAAFNTPLGGIVFLFEELARGITVRNNIFKISIIAGSGIVAVLLAGNHSYFGTVGHSQLDYRWSIFPVALVIGIFAALNNFIFARLVHYSTLSKTSMLNKFRIKHPYLISLVAGFMIALIGILSSGLSFGNGYVESTQSLAGLIKLPQVYYIYKMLASYFSTLSGVPGGYFATSLAIGNGIGSFVHSIIDVANVQQYALLGMVAFLAALTQAPVTSLVMVLQITYSQTFTLPLIVACLVATWLSMLLNRSIYDYQIENYLS